MMKTLSILQFILCSVSFAEDVHVGTLTQLEGRVQIFSDPKTKVAETRGSGNQVLFEGLYYQVSEATAGQQVFNGNIVRTAPNGKTRVVYSNGDSMLVGPGSAFRVNWKGDSAPQLDLMYGRLRGVISKEGPRNRLKIKTRTAVMGVRGTDFFIADDPARDQSEFTVFRGEVEVAPRSDTKPAIVKTGMSLDVLKEKPIEVRPTSKPEIESIQKLSRIESKVEAPTSEVQDKIEALNRAVLENVKKDVLSYQPELKDRLTKVDLDLEKIETIGLEKVVAKAPVMAPPHQRKKPSLSELLQEDRDPYETYFKGVSR